MPSSFLTALGAHVLVEASPCIKPATSSTSNRVTYACMCVCVCVCALASDSRKHMSVWLRHVCAPRKCEEGVAVHLLHHLPLLPPPPRPAPGAAALPRLPRSAWPVQGGMLGPAPPVWTRVCACACACARWRVIHARTCPCVLACACASACAPVSTTSETHGSTRSPAEAAAATATSPLDSSPCMTILALNWPLRLATWTYIRNEHSRVCVCLFFYIFVGGWVSVWVGEWVGV